ncbi:lamin protein [Salix suchowensis]|nr:lamin protein [Salix suchowensis]
MEDSGRTTVRKTVWSMAITAVAVMVILECAAAAEQLHKVGSRGWIPDYNYTDWLNQRHEHFYVGDWLRQRDKLRDCNDQGFIKNITRGGRDVVQLTEARPYYFLSSGGYCWGGMKVAINVEDLAPAPAPASTKNVSPPNILSRQMIVLIAFVLLWHGSSFFCKQ